MEQITYTVRDTLARGKNYTASTSIAGRYVTLGHYLLDNYTNEAALKMAVHLDAPGLLRAWQYTETEIAAWQQQGHTMDSTVESAQQRDRQDPQLPRFPGSGTLEGPLLPAPQERRRACPDCHGTTLNLSHPEDGGSCSHCFGGYVL